MSRASKAMAAVWRTTGLGVPSETDGGGSAWSTVYSAAVYTAYACLCVAYAFEVRRSEYGGGDPPRQRSGGSLQVRLIRYTDTALLFVAATAVYWGAATRRREHGRVRDRHAAVVRQLFGSPSHGRSGPLLRVAAEDACCCALYALLAAAVSLDVRRYAGPAPWTHAAVRFAGHYALLTGNVQFAVTVLALRRCYAELNSRMRAGRRADDGSLFESVDNHAPATTSPRRPDGGTAVTFVNGERVHESLESETRPHKVSSPAFITDGVVL